EHAYHIDFGAQAAAYVDRVMANLNWVRIGARYRAAVGEAVEDKLFRPYGAPVQDEATISVEELKAALEGDERHRPLLLDVCLPMDLPRRTDARRRQYARAFRAAAVGGEPSARPPNCGLLHLWFPSERQGCHGAAAKGLR